MKPRLAQATEQLVQWLQQDALPLWSQCGVDSRNGSSFEKLLPNGSPDLYSHRRMRVQARQIFVFSRAEQLGWIRGLDSVVRRMLDFSGRCGTLPCRSDGYVHLLDHEFQIADSKFDLYDHAFFIMGSAAAYRTYLDGADLRRAENIVEWLDIQFKHPAGGWYEGNYAAPFRRQNPHMHLFEAFLFLYETTRKPMWLNRARSILDLFWRHFYSSDDQVVHEFFDDDWRLAEGEAGAVVEPGHLMEWVWLLRWYQRCTDEDQGGVADALYQKALTIGRDPDSGLLYDAVDKFGDVRKATKRCWPVTEYIKASLSQARHGHPQAENHAAEGIELLFKYYIRDVVPGTYIDQRSSDNSLADASISASTLYHLLGAGIEAQEYAQSHALQGQGTDDDAL